MLKTLFAVILLAAMSPAQTSSHSLPAWRAKLAGAIPLLGHRNWILVVDSAYPLQVSPGVETIETNASQIDVVRAVLGAIDHSIQVRPVIFMDAELPFVTDEDAPGVTTYRSEVTPLLQEFPVEHVPHEQIIADVDEAGKTFRVLVLKTNMTIPYTSVFIRLDCKYWSADQEKRLRAKMAAK
jgi:D-ribose pyranose/furanose isomerase RbsD